MGNSWGRLGRKNLLKNSSSGTQIPTHPRIFRTPNPRTTQTVRIGEGGAQPTGGTLHPITIQTNPGVGRRANAQGKKAGTATNPTSTTPGKVEAGAGEPEGA